MGRKEKNEVKRRKVKEDKNLDKKKGKNKKEGCYRGEKRWEEKRRKL